MAVILCPNCGKENPDSLSVCQYCQTPLVPGSSMRIGDKPTKKNTGELETVLPDWLRDVRQQARDSAEQEASEAATMPKIKKEEPPDLLAGLASQSTKSEDEDLPDWLASLAPKKEEKPASSPPARSTSEFFAHLEKPGSAPRNEPEPLQPPSSENVVPRSSSVPQERDELSEWFAKASDAPSEPFALEPDSSMQDLEWDINEKVSPSSARETQLPSQEEDLTWLHDLEAEAKKTGELSQPRQDNDWASMFDRPSTAGSSSQEDLSWLDAFGGSSPTPQTPAPSPASQDDLSWLDNLGALPPTDQPAQKPSQPEEDLSWLGALSGAAAISQDKDHPPAEKNDLSWLDDLAGPSQPAQSASPDQEKPAAEEDLSWLRDLQGSPGSFSGALSDTAADLNQSAEAREMGAPASGEDLSWLRDLQGTPGSLSGALSETSFDQDQSAGTTDDMPHVAPFTPRRTAPLDDKAEAEPELPDWLKSATQEPSMPLGPQALDRMREEKVTSSAADEIASAALFSAMMRPEENQPASTTRETTGLGQVPPASNEAAPLFNDVSSLFSDELPDWLSSTEPAASQPAEEIGINAEGGEALAPAELPAWVQAMRPVEAVIAETAPAMDNLPVEREGPLAGLKGVLPLVALGSLRRPRPIPLTLQTTEEQQASASILEQILQAETTPRTVASAPVVTSEQTLRWIIAGLLFFVLGAMLSSGTQIMPISPVLPPEARDMTNVVMSIADNAPVLVIMDYQPALAGEMEAVSGPLLDQLVRLHNPFLSFVATSPSGNALVERLLANTNISQPGGTGYVSGQNYTNLGYLPGGEAGVVAFLQSPQTAVPASPVLNFSEYAAILLLSDHADSARTWVEQLWVMKQGDTTLAGQPLLVAASAQTGPMLQPYFSSGQITGMISGLPTAAGYESLNDSRPGMARTYWDAFGIGMLMAIFLIVLGSLWSVYSGMRANRMKTAEE